MCFRRCALTQDLFRYRWYWRYVFDQENQKADIGIFSGVFPALVFRHHVEASLLLATFSSEVLPFMNLEHLHHRFADLLKQRKLAYLLSGVLLLSNVCLSCKVMLQDEHWVIIP